MLASGYGVVSNQVLRPDGHDLPFAILGCWCSWYR